MTVESLMSRTGTLVRVTDTGPEDVYGNPTEQTSTSTVRYELQQARRDEVEGISNWQVGTWRLYLPSGTPVNGVDRFVDIDGVEYEFDGPPWKVHNPRTGATSHIEATVRSAT